MSLVYLAGAIDAASHAMATEWRGMVARHLALCGIATFNPKTAFTAPRSAGAGNLGEPAPYQEINNAALRPATAVFAEFYYDVPHVGTLLEIGMAVALGIPVVVWRHERFARHSALDQAGIYVEADVHTAIARVIDLVQTSGGPVLECLFDREAVDLSIDPAEWGRVFPVPTRAYAGDAGFDLPCARHTTIPPHKFVDVPLAFRLAPPPGHWYRIVGRSSTLRKFGLLVNEGIIDEGWRGPLFAGVWNMTDEPVTLEPGMRLVQVIPSMVTADYIQVRLVSKLRPGARGENGFGSTGIGTLPTPKVTANPRPEPHPATIPLRRPEESEALLRDTKASPPSRDDILPTTILGTDII